MHANNTTKSPLLDVVLGLTRKIFPESENNVWETGLDLFQVNTHQPRDFNGRGFVRDNLMMGGQSHIVTAKLTALSTEHLVETVVEFHEGGFSNGLGLEHSFKGFLQQLKSLTDSPVITVKVQARLKEIYHLCEMLDVKENYLVSHRVNITGGWINVVAEIQCHGVRIVIAGQFSNESIPAVPTLNIRYPYMITPCLLKQLRPNMDTPYGGNPTSGLRLLIDGKWVLAVSASMFGLHDNEKAMGMTKEEGGLFLGILASPLQLELCDELITVMTQPVWVSRVVSQGGMNDERLLVSFGNSSKYQVSLEFNNI